DPAQVQNAWVNEFVAPFEGITKVREAHGNRAAAELAVQICAEFPQPTNGTIKQAAAAQPPQAQIAAALAEAKYHTVTANSPSVVANYENPYFAHLAMCKDGKPAPVKPPLGWVLSNSTQKDFDKLFQQCGNDEELRQLKIALGQR